MTSRFGIRRFNLQLFGGGGGTSSQQFRKRDPESAELKNMRLGIYDKIFPSLQNYNPSQWTDAQGTADSALKSQQNLLSQAAGAGEKGNMTLEEMLGVVRSGKVPQAMEDAATGSINRGLQSGMGDMLNNLGGRGVINSSVTNSGISNLGTKAANAFQDAYLNNYNSVLSGYQGALNGLMNNTSSLLNIAQGYGGLGSQAFQNAGAALMPAYNFWKDMQSSYDNREDFDTVVQQGGKK